MLREGFIKVLLIVIAISLLLDWYVYNGLKTLTRSWKSHRLRQLVTRGYLFVSVGLLATFITGVPSFRTAMGMTPWHEWVLSLFLTILITKIIFAIVLSLGDLGRLFYGIIHKIARPENSAGQPLVPSRRRFISEAAVLIASVPFTGFLYAMLKGKYDYRVHKQTLYFADLPQLLMDLPSPSYQISTRAVLTMPQPCREASNWPKRKKATSSSSPATWSITQPGR